MKRTAVPVMARQKLVMIGNGMAGFKFCEKFVRYRLHKKFELTVFGEEPQPAYDRVNLTRFLTHGEERILAPASWYAQQGIRLRTGEKVLSIDREKKLVKTEAGTIGRYDLLVIATGSGVYIPPVDGIDLPGVFVYRTLNDLQAIKGFMAGRKKVTVIGGGILGLEAAKAMLDAKMGTVIIERAGQLMPRQLDAVAGKILMGQVEAMGLKVLLGKEITGIFQEENRLRIECSDGHRVETDMVLLSAGIVPRDELAVAAGLATGPKGGIVVNNFMLTSDPSIYAIGECALVHDRIWGLAAPCYEMAEVLAARLSGIYKVFRGDLLFTQLKVLDTRLAHIIAIDDSKGDGECIINEKQEAGIYKRIDLSADGKRITGAILLGDISDYASLLQLVRTRSRVPADPVTLIDGTAGHESRIASLPDGMMVCLCESVNKGTIANAIIERKLQRLDQVCQATRAGTGCETCQALIEEMITYYTQTAQAGADTSGVKDPSI